MRDKHLFFGQHKSPPAPKSSISLFAIRPIPSLCLHPICFPPSCPSPVLCCELRPGAFLLRGGVGGCRHYCRLQSRAAMRLPLPLLALVCCALMARQHCAAAAGKGKARHLRWEISNMFWSPDCEEKVVIGINGQFPGPTIRARAGDTVHVQLRNALHTEGVVIHWHGIRQVRNHRDTSLRSDAGRVLGTLLHGRHGHGGRSGRRGRTARRRSPSAPSTPRKPSPTASSSTRCC